MICDVKLWYIILINGDLCNRTRGLHRRKAINAKSGKERLILAQLHRWCVSLRTVLNCLRTIPSSFFDVKWQTNAPAETQYLAIQPVGEANIAIQKPQAVAEVQHGEPPQAPNDEHNKTAQLANSR